MKLPGRIAADRASFVVSFLIVAAAVGVLAYRSYQLAARMETGIHSFAIEYLYHAAEITAERAENAVNARLTGAADEWQGLERTTDAPSTATLRQWVEAHPWIISAIYIPDDDPVGAIYFTEALSQNEEEPTTNEFFSATGTVRYTFLPSRLLPYARSALKVRHTFDSASLPEANQIRKRSEIALVPLSSQPRVRSSSSRFSVRVPLTAPLASYAVRASIDDAYIGVGWENHRVVSLWLALIALALVVIATAMAGHGLKREAETVRLRGALIANVSHELRTPLSMIRLGIETLLRNPSLDEAHRVEIEQSVHREAMHLSHLVENVLDVARMEKRGVRLVRGSVDPEELVSSLVDSYEPWLASKGFVPDLDVDLDIPDQMWDREAISRALLNLIDNAVKYSQDEKVLIIELKDHPGDVAISVTDHGVGLDPADIRRIFEPYFRARFSDTETRRGAGLGLTLVHQIVRAHGGRVEVESARGKGSTFTMWLPKAHEGGGRRRKRRRHGGVR